MANAVVTIKLMPESPEVNIEELQKEALAIITSFAGKGDTKVEIIPIAFGLQALQITFIMNEDLGSPDKLEEPMKNLSGVTSFSVIDVRRAIG